MIYAILGYGMMAYNLYAGLHGGGWINYVFDEKFTARGKNPWEVYLKIRGSHIDKYLVENNLSMYKNGVIGYRGYLDIIAVKYGLEQLSKILVEELPNENDVNYRFRKEI